MSPTQLKLLALVGELRQDLDAAQQRLASLEHWSKTLAHDDQAYIPAALLHHFYTNIESALARSLAVFEGAVPAGPDSHSRILRLATIELAGVRPAIISAPEVDILRELLEFRHVFRHGYGISLRPERLKELSRLSIETWPRIRAALDSFVSYVERCAAKAEF